MSQLPLCCFRSQENISLTKDIQDIKSTMENVQYSKHQLQTALNDTTRRLEEEDRVRKDETSQSAEVPLTEKSRSVED